MRDWKIPRIDPAMAASRDDLPAEWFAWASAKPGLGRAHGRGVHFYVEDRKFSSLYRRCDTPVSFGAPVIVEPNYSTYPGYPPALALGDIYRKRWLARHWGAAGLKVLVDVNVDESFADLTFLGVPRGWPAYATRSHKDGSLLTIVTDWLRCCNHARSWTITFVVFGGGAAVADLAATRGWAWVPEASKVARGIA